MYEAWSSLLFSVNCSHSINVFHTVASIKAIASFQIPYIYFSTKFFIHNPFADYKVKKYYYQAALEQTTDCISNLRWMVFLIVLF